MSKRTIADILSEDDELGLLANLKPVPLPAPSDVHRVQQKFEEINQFIDQHGRRPGDVDAGARVSPSEKMLQLALSGIVQSANAALELASMDRHGLLSAASLAPLPPTSIDDIIAGDDALLRTPADAIFVQQHVASGRLPLGLGERKSERRPSAQFEFYKPLFDQCAADLANGVRQSLPFANEQDIQAGEFFILNGQMLYVAAVSDRHIRNGKANARLRLIFDNGTEGDNLLRSLSAELYKDPNGRRITSLEADAGPLFEVSEPSSPSSSSARQTGEIYVARSLSMHPDIASLNGRLHKIGFTSGSAESRIAAAKDDPTFLLAPAQLVRVFQVYDLDVARFENLVHRFFGEVRLDIELRDRFGRSVRPREWFLLPIEVIEEAVGMIVDGSIVGRRYDLQTGTIMRG